MAIKNEEKLVVDILNNTVTDIERSNPLFQDAMEIAEAIQNIFPSITKAEYTGDGFADRGDLIIFCDDGLKFIELKRITSSKNGKGTLANMSQNFLKEFDIFDDCAGWLDWRKRNGYKDKVKEILSSVEYGEVEVKDILSTEKVLDKGSEIEIGGRVLRKKITELEERYSGKKIGALPSYLKKAKNGVFPDDYYEEMTELEEKCIDACDHIIDLAREDLKGYLEDCKTKEINKENMYKLVLLLKCGYHTLPLIKEHIEIDAEAIKLLSDDYYIFYHYPKRERGDRVRVETPEVIKAWLPSPEAVGTYFDGESLWVTAGGEKMLQFKFHWRNVFFGIQTPSVEVFDKCSNHV